MLDVLPKIRALGGLPSSVGRASILLHKTERQVKTYILTDETPAGHNFAQALARAVGGQVAVDNRAGDLDDSSLSELVAGTEAVSVLSIPAHQTPSKVSQQGMSPSEVAERARASLAPNSWVCVVMRSASKSEIRNVHRWYKFFDPTRGSHHTQDKGQVSVAVYAGSDSWEDNASVLESVAGSLPGFDLDSRVEKIRPTYTPEIASVTVLLASVAAYFVTKRTLPELLGVGVIALVMAVLFYRGIITSPSNKRFKELQNGVVPSPPKRKMPAQAPREAQTKKDGTELKERAGAWPLHRNTVMCSPTLIFPLASPYSETDAEVGETRSHGINDILLNEGIGPIVGVDPSSQRYVHLPQVALPGGGIGIFGEPGSGKTELMQTLFGWSLLQRQTHGAFQHNSIFVFETKGEASNWFEWVKAYDAEIITVKVNDVSTPTIDLLHLGQTPQESATIFVEIMTAGFEEGAIQYQSQNTLALLLSATLTFPMEQLLPTVASDVPANPITAAHILCGGRGEQMGIDLYGAIAQYNATHITQAGTSAMQGLASFYGENVTRSQRNSLFSAPVSKLAVLAKNLGPFFSTKRSKFALPRALDKHWIVVIDYGTSVTAGGSVLDGEARETITGMLFYELKREIEANCSGWQAQGRYSSIFIDEVAAMPVATRNEAIGWMRNQGRSYGVIPYLAAQNPDQLTIELRNVLMSMGTFFALKQASADALKVMESHLSIYGGWSVSELASLPAHEAIIRTTIDSQAQTGAHIELLKWSDSPDRMLAYAEEMEFVLE
jgi:hypothetical protein